MHLWPQPAGHAMDTMTTLPWQELPGLGGLCESSVTIAGFVSTATTAGVANLLFASSLPEGAGPSMALTSLVEWLRSDLMHEDLNELLGEPCDDTARSYRAQFEKCQQLMVHANRWTAEAAYMEGALCANLVKIETSADKLKRDMLAQYPELALTWKEDPVFRRKMEAVDRWMAAEQGKHRAGTQKASEQAKLHQHNAAAAALQVLQLFQSKVSWGGLLEEKVAAWSEMEATEQAAARVLRSSLEESAAVAPWPSPYNRAATPTVLKATPKSVTPKSTPTSEGARVHPAPAASQLSPPPATSPGCVRVVMTPSAFRAANSSATVPVGASKLPSQPVGGSNATAPAAVVATASAVKFSQQVPSAAPAAPRREGMQSVPLQTSAACAPAVVEAPVAPVAPSNAEQISPAPSEVLPVAPVQISPAPFTAPACSEAPVGSSTEGQISPAPSEPLPVAPVAPSNAVQISSAPSEPLPVAPVAPSNALQISVAPSEPLPVAPVAPSNAVQISSAPSEPLPVAPVAPSNALQISVAPSEPLPVAPVAPSNAVQISSAPSEPLPVAPVHPSNAGQISAAPSEPLPVAPVAPKAEQISPVPANKPLPVAPVVPGNAVQISAAPSEPLPVAPVAPSNAGQIEPAPTEALPIGSVAASNAVQISPAPSEPLPVVPVAPNAKQISPAPSGPLPVAPVAPSNAVQISSAPSEPLPVAPVAPSNAVQISVAPSEPLPVAPVAPSNAGQISPAPSEPLPVAPVAAKAEQISPAPSEHLPNAAPVGPEAMAPNDAETLPEVLCRGVSSDRQPDPSYSPSELDGETLSNSETFKAWRCVIDHKINKLYR